MSTTSTGTSASRVTPSVLAELAEIVGTDGIDVSDAALRASSHDAWPVTVKWARLDQHPYTADVIVKPADSDQVARLLRSATEHGIPVTPHGLGSSVTGQDLPQQGGIVLDLSRLVGSVRLEERDLTVTASAGTVGGELEAEVARAGYTLGHSPQSLLRSTVGGWVATMASGQFSSRYGGIEDLLVGYTVLLADGTQYRLSASPRAAVGPDLRKLFIGSEGTLGVVTSVTLKIFPRAEHRRFDVVRVPSVRAGLDILREQAAVGLRPFLLRLYDADEARHATKNPEIDSAVLFLGTEGLRSVADAEHDALLQIAARHGAVLDDRSYTTAWMERRFDFSSVENRLSSVGGYAETVEVAHLWSGIEDLYAALKSRLAGADREVLAHFSHVYTQGTSLYIILMGQAADDAAALTNLQDIWSTAMETCLEFGAELSHHHGGGLARANYIERSLGSNHALLKRLKSALDPAGLMNPGKLDL